eukprot:gene5376-551_t
MAYREENEAVAAQLAPERPVPAPRSRSTIIDIATISGKDKEDITEWLIKWDIAATANGWQDQHQLQMLPAYLSGRAARTFWKIPHETRQDLESMKEALEDLFNTEEKRFLARQKLQETTQGSRESVMDFAERIDCLVEAITAAERREVYLNSMGKKSRVNEIFEDVMATIQRFNEDRAKSNEEIWKAIQNLTLAVQNLAAQSAQSAAPIRTRIQPETEARSRFRTRARANTSTSHSIVAEQIRSRTVPFTQMKISCPDANAGEVGEGIPTFPEAQDIPVDLNCSLASRLAKEGVWVRGHVNNVDSDIFLDTGAKYSLMDFDFWKKVNLGNRIVDSHVCLVGAGGKALSIVGKGRVWLEIGNIRFDLPVIIVEQFKFDLLLGDEFLREQNVVIDYGRKKIRLGCTDVSFENLPSECIAVLGSVTSLPVGTPVRIRAKLFANHCGLALFGERQLVKTDERVMFAPVVTKADINDSVLIELVNTTRSEVSLQPGTKLVHLQPFVSEVNSVHEDQADKDACAVLPFEDLKISHLSDEQQANLLHVLKKHHVWPKSNQLGTTRLVEHSIDVQEAQPVRQRPYRVPETKRQQIAKEPSKCHWMKESVKFLGHIISGEGVKVDPAKIDSVRNFPVPKNATDVRSFLGLTSYYRRFIANFARRSKALAELTKKKRIFHWTEEAQRSFEDLKSCLATAPILRCPDFNLPFKLYTDACDDGIGAVLAQDTSDGEVVVAYASRLLKSSELKYAVLQKEALGIVWSLKHFYPYLYGRHFTVVTDHRPLKWLKTMNAPNNLFARWISEIQSYDFNVVHRPGRLHSNADTLSRNPQKGEENLFEISSQDFSQMQRKDNYAGQWIRFLTHNSKPEDKNLAVKFEREKDQHFIAEDGCVFRRFRGKQGRTKKQLIVPKTMVGQLLVKFHDNPLSGHPGFFRTYRKIQMSYFWPTMKSDIKRHVRHCKDCARFKSTKPATKTPLKSIETERPLQIVAMDFVGPLPKSDQGNQYALVLVDHFTRWPVVYPVEDTEAETVARSLRDFIHCYGCPEELLSDRGSQFTSKLVKALCKQLGVKKIFTCSFRPSTNGLNEHLNGTLFNAVKIYASKKPSTWDEYLDAVTFAFRTTPHSVTMHTPAFLMYGREVNSPLDMKPPTPSIHPRERIGIKRTTATEDSP